MRKTFFAVLVTLGVVGPLQARDLYLLIGQSNMAGRGVVTDANRLSSERVWKFTKDCTWGAGDRPRTNVVFYWYSSCFG